MFGRPMVTVGRFDSMLAGWLAGWLAGRLDALIKWLQIKTDSAPGAGRLVVPIGKCEVAVNIHEEEEEEASGGGFFFYIYI